MQNASRMLLTFLLNSLWQVTLIGGVVWLLSPLLRHVPARYRCRLWAGALFASVLLPIFTLAAPTFGFGDWLSSQRIAAQPGSATHNVLFSGMQFHLPATGISLNPVWLAAIAWTYGLFLVARGIRLAGAWRKTNEIRKAVCALDAPAELSRIISRCQSALGVAAPVLRSALAGSPLTLGIRNPAIILPKALIQSARAEDWTAALLHEMAHIRRRDFQQNLLHELLHWPVSFHPVANLIRREIVRTRELACDEMAADLIGSRTYARSLVSIAALLMNFPGASHADYSLGVFDANILEERVMKLLHSRSVSPFRAKTLLMFAAAALMASSIGAAAFGLTISIRQDQPTAAQAAAMAMPIASQGDKPLKVGDGVTPPRAIFSPNPDYPASAVDAKISGQETLLVEIGKDGQVQDIHVVKSLGHEFDLNSMDAVKKWKFEPTQKDGKAVPVEVRIEIVFKLQDSAAKQKYLSQQ
jgi:TonB family protein